MRRWIREERAQKIKRIKNIDLAEYNAKRRNEE